MKRNRYKQTPTQTLNGTQELQNPNTGSWFLNSTTPFVNLPPRDFASSAMIDWKTDGEWHYQNCEHESLTALYAAFTGGLDARTADLSWITNFGSQNIRLSVPCSKIIADLKTQHGAEVFRRFPVWRLKSMFANRALPKNIVVDRDPFESQFSVWYLIADVVELPRLVAQIFKRKLFRRRKEFGGNTLKQLADDHLMDRFGVRPTYDDVTEFIGAVRRFTEGYDEFQKTQHKIYRWHGEETPLDRWLEPEKRKASFYWPQLGPYDQNRVWSSLGFGVLNILTRYQLHSAIHYRTMAYRFLCPEMQGWLARLKQFVDTFGLLDPAAAWDLIPWSFVADWFLPIGEWLHDNRPRLFPADIQIVDYCESIKVHDIVSHIAFRDQFYGRLFEVGLTDGGGARFSDEQYKTYLRYRYKPTNAKIGQSRRKSIITLRRCLIAASLVAQRLPR